MTSDLSIYIHYPFCKSKCPYCDFNSHVKDGVNHEEFLKGYFHQLDFFKSKASIRKIKTIFFGGGTPSLMPPIMVEKILNKISALWNFDENCEITLEANPTSFESEKFYALKLAGINRISLGIQALNDDDLKFLGRNHTKKESIETIKNASKIFENFSFDLIYARPNQSIKSWREELLTAIDFGTKHLSLYQLTIEKGTKFFSQFNKKEFTLPDEELSANLYEVTNEITDLAGFKNYEISNYAKKDYESRHNLSYWKSYDYAGIGAGAHSRIYFDGEKNRSALMMIHDPISWLNSTNTSALGIQNISKISENELLQEVILMGLRLEEGIENKIFQTHFKKNIDEIFKNEKLQRLENQGFIKTTKDYIKITKAGKILTNAIIEKVVDAICNEVVHGSTSSPRTEK